MDECLTLQFLLRRTWARVSGRRKAYTAYVFSSSLQEIYVYIMLTMEALLQILFYIPP
jgi:hypothetical protein